MESKKFYRKTIQVDTFYQIAIIMNLIDQANKNNKSINLRQILKTYYGFSGDLLDREVRSISSRIRDFEEMFAVEVKHSKKNIRLIQKSLSNKSYRLTRQGEKILPYLMKIKSYFDDITSILEEGEHIKRIRVSSVESFLSRIIPHIILEYTELRKNVVFDVINCFSLPALKGLEDLDNDIAFIVKSTAKSTIRTANNPNFKYYTSNFNDYPICICPKDRKDDIRKLPFISFVEGTSWSDKVELWLREKSIITASSFKVNAFDTILSLVNNGIGWSVIPASVIYNKFTHQIVKENCLNIEVFDRWEEEDKSSELYVVTRKDNPHYITEFIEFLINRKYILPLQ